MAENASYSEKLEKMKVIWKKKIEYARGKGQPKVVRYTADSEAERSLLVKPN